ncbi:MAG TPA: PQQ-dependent sugar dehydrogenase, partial [Phycisphaerae bacterium]|nr:PQQ-dependent sugar dehydrogenase [Phycisphaerae bacterium]
MRNGGFPDCARRGPMDYRGGQLLIAALVVGWTGVGVASAQIPTGDITVRLEPVASGLISPTHLTHAGDGSGRLFIVDQAGFIRIVKNGVLLPTPFLDLTAELPTLNTGFDERGVLGLAFHPNYASNGRFFVRFSRPRTGASGEACFGTSRGCHEEILAEFSVSGNPDVANPTPTILFAIDEPQFNHNSGGVAFGPDGYLYFTLGDGGGANDGLDDPNLPHGPIGNGQNINTPLGSMLRIDVDGGSPYAIPADNPFVGTNGLDEIYAYGFRNPFRFSFDDGPGGDGRLIVADVGQALIEELDIVTAGGNYGWVIREGAHCFDPFNPGTFLPSCDSNGLIDPIAEYTHTDGGISIIGGYVYRGAVMPGLAGTYFFGDFSADFSPTGRLYYLDESNPGNPAILRVRLGADDAPFGRYLKGMGEDEDGEIYVLGSTDLGPTGTSGEVLRLAPLYGDCDGDGDVGLDDYASFAACLGGPDVPAAPAPQTVNVSVGPGFVFTPADISINVGDTVHWFWAGGFHNVESGVGGV